MWYKYITRRLAVQVAQAWNFGWGEAMQKVYGTSVTRILVFRDDKKTEYYVEKKEFDKYVNDLYNLLKNKKFLHRFHSEAQATIEKILWNAKKKLGSDLGKLNNQELLAIYTNFILPNQENFYVRMWTVFNIGEPLANVVRQKLAEYVSEDEIDRYLLSLSSPLVPNDVLNERIGLLKLYAQKQSANFPKRLAQHVEKYRHIPMFDFDHEPYGKEHFLHEISMVKNPEKELAELNLQFAEKKKEFGCMLKELKLDTDFKLLLQFLKENVFLRDYRDMIRQKFNLELRKFYSEVGKRLGLNIEEVAVLTNGEIIEHLKKKKKFDRKVIQQRKKAYLLIQEGSRARIFSGNTALIVAKRELKTTSVKAVSEVKGIIGSKGKARGIVKVVFTNKDLSKIVDGDILVATMTRQDFVPAMRKARAIVTDEGSVTCHAAIISREMKKPCIVAAKIATKIFKDGDFVEVDANKGIVRRIK